MFYCLDSAQLVGMLVESGTTLKILMTLSYKLNYLV